MAREPFAARLTTLWIGSVFFWLIKGFKGTYASYLAERYAARNLIAGYAIQIIFLALIVWLIFH